VKSEVGANESGFVSDVDFTGQPIDMFILRTSEPDGHRLDGGARAGWLR
jgi:hypothetical protein